MNINYKNIKLVIWDLDDTFWQGTISEGATVPIEENIKLVKDLTDRGIINSICSKNEYDVAVKKLKELNIFEYFVFSSINWDNKGLRIKNQISVMALRPANVLFIDDNIVNLQEALFYMPDLMVAEPNEILSELINYVENTEAVDLKHKRLSQYHLLQEKSVEQQRYTSNEEFLFASNIQVSFHEDCNNEFDRILELINRTNQLNYTKKRISETELNDLLQDSNIRSGYITVKDRFGDYGIVGFFALRDTYLEHFLFSCRTMGQEIEQYVYATLGFPQIEIIGDVQSKLDKNRVPQWINQQGLSDKTPEKENILSVEPVKILIKGPCDLSKSQTYIKYVDALCAEFTYVNTKGQNIIEGHNHSIHIIGLKENTEDMNNQIISDCLFVDPDMLRGTFFDGKYDMIFLSTIIESGYGIYRKKDTNIKVAFADYNYPITEERNWDDYISGKRYNGNNLFSIEYLAEFSQKYEFIGKTTPQDYIEMLKKMFSFLPSKTILCLILAAEHEHKNSDTKHLEHIELNNAIREYAKTNSQLKYIDISKIAVSTDDFTNTINHFSTRVYYEIAREMTNLINQSTKIKIEHYSSWLIHIDTLLYKIKDMIKKIIHKDGLLYTAFRTLYLKISRKNRK